jgi:hypothetical protein
VSKTVSAFSSPTNKASRTTSQIASDFIVLPSLAGTKDKDKKKIKDKES